MKQAQIKAFFSGRKILITGGLGFIGSNLAGRLVEMKADVTLVDSLIPQYGGNLFNIRGIEDKVKVNISDIRDRFAMDCLVKDKDFIFNLAGTLSHIDSMNDPFTDLEINCAAQLSILEACRKNNPGVKILFAGTRGQYGKAEYLPVDERHPIKPLDVNGINNQAAESYHILYNSAYGIKATSLRLTNTYGPRHQMRHPRQGIINWFIRKIIDGETVEIFGDGEQKRDLNFVQDVVSAMLLAIVSDATSGEAFNLGGEAVSLAGLVKLMIEINGKGKLKLVTYPRENQKIEVGDYVADYSKFKNLTGWKPETGLEEGIRKTFEYYRKFKKHYW